MKRLAVLAFIWGWSFLFIKVAVAGMTPTTVAAIRVGLGAVVLLGVLRAQGLALPRDLSTWKQLAFTAVFANVVPFTLLAWGEERITSALTSVLNASTPLAAVLFGALLLGERLSRGQMAGLALGALGVAVAAGLGGDDLASSSWTGAAAAVLAGVSYGLAFVWVRHRLSGLVPDVAAAGMLVASTALLAGPAVVTSAFDGFSPTPTRLLAIGLLGLVGTGVAYVVHYRIIAEVGPTKASLVTYLVPAVAVLVGVVALDEPFSWPIVAGGGLIVAGIALVHQRVPLLNHRNRRPPTVDASATAGVP